MIESLIISAIVMWAVLYSAWSLMPARVRQALAGQAAACARKLGLGERHVQGMQTRLAQSGNCGACSSCRGCGKPAKAEPAAVDKDIDPH